jgi:hypothetical protein
MECSSQKDSSLEMADRRDSSIAFAYVWRMLGLEWPIIWATKMGDALACVRRLAKVLP